MTWEHLSTLPPLRDEHGTIVLEEADDDTHTATFRIYGRTSLTATVTPTGHVHFSTNPPPALRAATQGSDPSISTQRSFAPPEAAGRQQGSDPFVSTQRGRRVAAGVAAVGIVVLAARRRQ